MRRIFLSLLLLTASLFSFAQEAKWTYTTNSLGNQEFELIFKVNIADGYYMYSQDKTDGPLPLEFVFTPGSYQLINSVKPTITPKEKFDDGFGINVKYFDGTATFIQKVKVTESTTIKGEISYQTCSATGCIPGDSEFSFKVDASAVKSDANESVTINEIETDGAITAIPIETIKVENVKKDIQKEDTKKDKSLIGFFILAFAMGIAGVMTPCVFPMIPMVVSFFISGGGSKSEGRIKGIIFGLSVTLIYTLIGVIVGLTQNDTFATFLASNGWVNLAFFILFMVFALSFFGMFEINLPTGIANSADKRVDKGGYSASFFLAVVLAIVSFSCTGPFVGSLLVEASQGGMALKPIAGMFGFGLGLGLPFMIFAFLPELMKKLPKSGGWLNSVKVFFAFILSAFAIKFLDIADTYWGWGLITRDVAIAYWIVLFVLLGLYLLGKIKFSHDSDIPYVSIFRFILATLSFVVAVYLIPGLFGASLSNVSAFLPSQDKQVFTLNSGTPLAIGVAASNTSTAKYSDFLHLPKGINGYFDLKEGMDAAAAANKPVLIDFKGHFCSNCKKMESSVFTDPRVIDILNNKFIVIGLYTDDKTEVPESEYVTLESGKVLKTIGTINRNYQRETYQMNAQPYFVILTSKGDQVNEGLGYESSTEKFLEWLEDGLKKL